MKTGKEYLAIIRELCTPDEHYSSVFDIPMESLFTQGFRNIVLDVDNTLITYNQKKLSLRYMNWIDKAKSIGFSVYLLSNNRSYDRINRIIQQTETQGFHFSCKPLSYSLKALSRNYNFRLKETIIIGDQLLTDIVLGKWTRTYSILVDPIDKRMSFIKTVQRDVEIKILDWLASHR